MSKITVTAAPDVEPGRVVLWDRDAAHPDGEVFLAKAHEGEDERTLTCEATPGVNMALNSGRLVRVEGGAAKPAAKPGS